MDTEHGYADIGTRSTRQTAVYSNGRLILCKVCINLNVIIRMSVGMPTHKFRSIAT